MRAALHVHSTFSDGEFTLLELREKFLRAGCRVVCVVDHAEAFDAERLARFTEGCARHSDGQLLLLPGLEFECRQRLHIVGYGVVTRSASQEPEEIVRHIADQGGVSVIAHPKTEFFDWIRGFSVLPDGIEAWNTKYDGKHAPRPETFELIQELRAQRRALQAFYGIDLHWRHQYSGLLVDLDLSPGTPDRETVLAALRTGHFEGVVQQLRLPSSALVPPALLRDFGRRHRRSQRLRAALRQAKRLVDSISVRAPERLKAQLRRLF
jgi:hypothetical protein